MQLNLKVNAKINLFLDITGKLPNGYHTLNMLMQSVDLSDEITLDVQPGRSILLSCNAEDVPCNEKNTAYRAAMEFCRYTGIQKEIQIFIDKKIPRQAGLAGGSADAAGVIMGLNRLFHTDLSVRELIQIGFRVGSDVPFCLFGGTSLVQNAGDVIAPLPLWDKNDIYYVLCKPSCDVSTAQAYAQYDNSPCIRHPDSRAMLAAAAQKDIRKVCSLCENIFEQFIEVPDRAVIKAQMRKHNSLACCMSGSGPTVYGVFETQQDAENCRNLLLPQYENTFIAHPADTGVEIRNI